MKTVTIAEFKSRLPELLEEVARGERIVVQKGRKRTNVAILSPFDESALRPRQLGLLARRGKPVFRDWELSEDDFLASRP
jgi:antitoxin (DNA-binding transcriptional repressor) of toxin-antitoxin stability system